MNTVAIGDNATTKGECSIALGARAKAKAMYAIGLGYDSNAENNAAISIGYKSSASNNAVSIGYNASANAEATNSIALGYNASSNATDTIAIGNSARAVGKNSVAIGKAAFAEIRDAIAVGNEAKGYHYLSTAIGAYSKALMTCSTAIGAYSDSSMAFSTAIGYKAKTTDFNQIVLGTKDDIVYIPGKLVVGQHSYLGMDVKDGTSSVWLRAHDGGGSCKHAWIYDRSGTGMYLSGEEAKPNPSGEGSYSSYTQQCDRRLKNVGKVFTGGLEQLRRIQVYNYTFKKDSSNTPQVGVMAQDLQKIFPNAVKKGEDGFLRIRTDEIVYSLVNAVKELDKKVTYLMDREKKINDLEKRIEALEKKVK